MINPGGVVYLCNVPWDRNYNHISDGATPEALIAGASHAFTQYTYTRKDKILKLGVSADAIVGANYVIYKNVGFSSKYYYAFIQKVEFISENSCFVYLETDVYQTWKNNITFGDCFVEREHVLTDTIGDNTIPENLELGEYIKNSQADWTALDNLATIVVITKTAAGARIHGRVYNGIFSALAFVPFFGTGYVDDLVDFLETYDSAAIDAAVVAIFTYPSALLPAGSTSGTTLTGDTFLSTYITKTVTINKTTIDGYTPKNNKLFCWPYNFLHITNLQGQSLDLKLEMFDAGYPSSTLSFHAKGCLMPGARVITSPSNYKVHESWNYEEAITLANYPLCAWTSDVWKNWIGQNALGVATGFAGSGLAIAAAGATGQAMGVAGGIIGIANQLSTVYQAWIAPPSVHGNINNASVNVAVDAQHFVFNQMQIRAEYAAIIDDYFSMFGYKVCRVKAPQMTGRAYWNYIKTVDCIIMGGIPVEDKAKLESIFNKGVTVWHEYGNIGDYSLTNSIS